MKNNSLLVKPTMNEGACIQRITPKSAGWSHIGFEVLQLMDGDSVARHMPERETCIILVAGNADIYVNGRLFSVEKNRLSPFEDIGPYAVFVPYDTPYTIEARGALEVALCTAPGTSIDKLPPRLIVPSEELSEVRGRGTNTRIVRNILPETEPADSLLVVEVITPGGNWSSYLPHKHDTTNGARETELEETYYHRINPSQGFAFQRVYTDDLAIDETMTVEDHDVVLVPRGYHPVGAPHGYDLYSLNVMAGPKRRWCVAGDPDRDWIAQKS